MPRKISKTVRNIALTVVIPVAVLAAGGGGLYSYNEWTGNIHVVDAGQVYRSAQLSSPEFGHVITTTAYARS